MEKGISTYTLAELQDLGVVLQQLNEAEWEWKWVRAINKGLAI